jgi:hypothetical protein
MRPRRNLGAGNSRHSGAMQRNSLAMQSGLNSEFTVILIFDAPSQMLNTQRQLRIFALREFNNAMHTPDALSKEELTIAPPWASARSVDRRDEESFASFTKAKRASTQGPLSDLHFFAVFVYV